MKIRDIHLAAALLTYGATYIGVVSDDEGLFYEFTDSIDVQNIVTLYEKQKRFLVVDMDEKKNFMSRKRRRNLTEFGDIQEVYRESKKGIKGAPRKSNGTWKQ